MARTVPTAANPSTPVPTPVKARPDALVAAGVPSGTAPPDPAAVATAAVVDVVEGVVDVLAVASVVVVGVAVVVVDDSAVVVVDDTVVVVEDGVVVVEELVVTLLVMGAAADATVADAAVSAARTGSATPIMIHASRIRRTVVPGLVVVERHRLS